jgi:hypothetical protein
MKISSILNSLLRVGTVLSYLGNFLVKISQNTADADLVSRIKADRDRFNQSQESHPLTNGVENEKPDNEQRDLYR